MKRIIRPTSIIVISLFLVATPFINLYQLLFFGQRTHWIVTQHPFTPASILGFTMIVLALCAGIGIYQIRRWGWYCFLAFAVVILAVSAYRIVTVRTAFAFLIAALNVAVVIGTLYLISRNVRKPYFSNEFRGWRIARRVPLRLPVQLLLNPLTGRSLDATTEDFSELGALIPLANNEPGFSLGQTVRMSIKLENDEPMTIAGEIVQFRDGSDRAACIGLRFYVDDARRNRIALFIRHRYTPRYECAFPIDVATASGNALRGTVSNMSSGGCYVMCSTGLPLAGEEVECTLYTKERARERATIGFSGTVTWVNRDGRYDKPRGFGVHIGRVSMGRGAFILLHLFNLRRKALVR